MYKHIIAIGLASLFLISNTLAATISGRVTDIETSQGVISATVREQGTNKGALTDSQGYYSFDTDQEDGYIIFSFIGYTTREERFDGNEVNFNFPLLPDGYEIEEIVVSKTKCQRNYPRVGTKRMQCNKCRHGLDNEGLQQYRDFNSDQCIQCSVGQKVNEEENSCIIDPNYNDPASDATARAEEGNAKTNPDYGLRCDMTTLLHGNCGMNIYNMLGIRQSNPDTTPEEFVQDIVLTATTFIGTVLTFALVISALMIIFGGANENTASRGRKGIRYALIGYALVLCSYLIIRLVQYIAG